MKSLGSLLLLLLITVDLLASSAPDIRLSGPNEPVFVGEPFALELIVTRCDSAESVSPMVVEPNMRDLWLKKVYKTVDMQEAECSVSKRGYSVTAQKSGLLQIAPVEVKLAFNEGRHDAWGNLKRERYWESHFSNTLELNVKSLPEDTTLVGVFTFVLDVPKTEATAGAAIDTEITVEGVGNFEDISVALPMISGVTIFQEEPELKYIDNTNRERWRQKITFMSEDDFIIPSISLEYFDVNEEAVKTVQTEAVSIHLIGEKSTLLPRVSKRESVSKNIGVLRWWIAVAGVIGLLFLIGVSRRVLSGRAGRTKVSYRDHKGLLHLLLLHRDDEGIQEVIETLEASVYEGKEMNIDQKELKKLVKKYR